MFRKPTLLGSRRAKGKPRKIKNVVVFGETGVGKSSLINLIAGQNVSQTSSSAVGCTLSYQRYLLKVDDQRFAIWDTAGLDEGSRGTVPADKAEAYLKQLLRDLAKTNGIDLLIYCVRGTRVRSALLTNYHLFYSAICRKKVPIAIVITGLENQEGDMDTWWWKNERQFLALKMRFDGYACVTTLQSSLENDTLDERRRISKEAVIKMITNTCRTERWMPSERSWADTAFADIHAILSPKEKNRARVANVIMCNVSRHTPVNHGVIKRSVTFQNHASLSHFLARLVSFRSPVSVTNEESQSKLPFNVSMKSTPERLCRLHQVPRKQLSFGAEEEMKDGLVIKRGADLLIFCVEKRAGGSRDVKLQWEHFNLTYGGDLSPQIVIVIGATNQQSAEEWWNDTVLGGAITKPGDASITYWPIDEPIAEVDARGRLRDLVNARCIDCSKVNISGDKRIFRRGTLSRPDKVPPWLRLPTKNSKVDEPPTYMDVLTEWGIWEHVSTEKNSVIQDQNIIDISRGH